MKKLAFLLLLALVAVSLPLHVQANDYLEVQSNYSVYSTGREAIHFKIPIWAYGRVNNYYLANYSYVYFKEKGSSDVWYAVWFNADREGENKASNGKGTGSIFITPGRGNLIITNTYDGIAKQVNEGDGWIPFTVKQGAVNDCAQLTTLEFDWYPPESLNGKKFTVGLSLTINKYSSGEVAYTKDFSFPTVFTGGENLQAPQLYTPYLYMINEEGNAGYGYAAIPYMTFQTPVSYTTSFDPTKTIKTSSRSGNIFVQTEDTVQKNVTAEFTVYRDETLGTLSTVTTPGVDIPAYHRIYDFQAMEEQDESGSLTGANIVSWSLRSPSEQDLVDGDYFEVQRAYESDYSDAQTMEVVAMKKGVAEYSYTDNSRTEWEDRNFVRDTIRADYSVTEPKYILRDASGKPLYEMSVKLTADKCIMPAQPVYYRVRRASSAAWGWDHEFVEQTDVFRHNYLAPLAAKQPDYTLDPDFKNNRTVHFHVKIDNADISYMPPSIDSCRLEPSFDACLADTAIMYVYVSDEIINSVSSISFRVKGCEDIPLSVGTQLVKVPFDQVETEYGFYVVPIPGTSFNGLSEPGIVHHMYLTRKNFDNCNGSTLNVTLMFSYSWFGETCYRSRCSRAAGTNPEKEKAEKRWEQVKGEVKKDLYGRLFGASSVPAFGKCIWDRTAKLVLTRTHIETGDQTEIIVPQDSILRQEDGSWLAHFTDVAAAACTHYQYTVRIDQSEAVLHVSDSIYLKPKTLRGPELYFNEAANIRAFSATQGATEGSLVNAVRLVWQPTSLAVDDYVLCRIVKDSDQVPDTLTVTTENSFLDTKAVPGVHYEYTLTTRYTCNGFTTANQATTEGWRTPYGRISGHVMLADYSGQKGITVTLSQGDNTIAQTTTNTAGEYVFDSVEYDHEAGSLFVITPTAQYGSFSYNGTSSGAAAVALSKENALLTDIDFVNTQAHRLTGRALYKNSTVPVADAMFLLNGDTICKNGLPVRTGIDGSFELLLPQQPLSLQIIKQNHTFDADGKLIIDDSDEFTPVKPIDGVRFYDRTKVRLIGRVAGGIDQQALPHGFGLGKNNLGDDLQLVLMLEGDNTAHIVHDPDDLTHDTVMQTIGNTHTLFEQKRIIIRPDIQTGEYAVDLFPVRYKVVQATAKGYATLFPSGTGSETFDLTNAPLQTHMDTLHGDTVYYHSIYDRIYRTPIQIKMTQVLYGEECAGLGEKTLATASMTGQGEDIPLYTVNENGEVSYLLGYPVFIAERKYQFTVSAFEDYYYNNSTAGIRDRVPQRDGNVRIVNDMDKNTTTADYPLDKNGQNKNVLLDVKKVDVNNTGVEALRTVTAALEVEGSHVETDVISAFVSGNYVVPADLHSTTSDVVLLDIVRDPGGTGSSAWIESGTTYKYAYTETYKWDAGLEITPKYGLNVTQDIGLVTAPMGAGSYIGSTYNTSKQLSLTFPIVHSWKWGYKYNYDFTTTDKISTAGSYSLVGSNADVFLGATTSRLSGKVKSVALINDSLWQARQPAVRAGTLKKVAQGTGADGKPYYLVIGQQVIMGSRIDNTFVYTQTYILNTLIPELAQERQDKLEIFADSAAAQAVADARDEAVYWDLTNSTNAHLKDTLGKAGYAMIVPQNSNKVFNNEVQALDNIILKWLTILYQNEKEKVVARMSGQHVGTWSVSGGTSVAHSDSYSAAANYNEMPQGSGLIIYELKDFGVDAGKSLLSQLGSMKDFWGERKSGTIGKSVSQIVSQYFQEVAKPAAGENGWENVYTINEQKPATELGTVTNASKWTCSIAPVLNFNGDDNRSQEKAISRKTGFTISPDTHGDITISVYRAHLDSVWEAGTKNIRKEAGIISDDMLYGSYVFYTESGTTYCPHEPEERTNFYNKGTLIAADTRYAAKPEMTLDTYSKVNVPAENAAIFHITLMNNTDEETSKAAEGEFMTLSLSDGNPNGARVLVDGQNLAAGYQFYIKSGEPIVKTLEVYRGTVDDYDDMVLRLAFDDCPKIFSEIKLSVHFIPVSTDVRISTPRDKWVMNTLSAHDSIGYYLPVEIDGFDINHKNFDHIEFQYKLSTENDDAWVNQCSFYASDSLYNLATGNKAMIENGRITPFRFYGERDPKELNYDLRAVSFCRYGSGFVTKSSPVISGIKDTRPPVLFGKPLPANGILTLDGDIKLRFSEPIAGNWLDEDNNFQVLGVTNATGITQTTSLYFDGKENHYAASLASRELAITDLTLDMLIKPAEKGREMILFSHGDDNYSFAFSLTADNRLKFSTESEGEHKEYLSLPMDELSSTDFTRVIMSYGLFDNSIRFYAGTKDITDNDFIGWVLQDEAAPLRIGAGLHGENPFHGNMMEVRVWTKALSPAEIANTHLRRLTGFEHGLMAYYPMRECTGDEIIDLATGATLAAKGLSWTTPNGISLTTDGNKVRLQPTLFSRTEAEDYTFMCWFRSDNSAEDTVSLFGTAMGDSVTMQLAFSDGAIRFTADDVDAFASADLTDGKWHHCVLVVSKTYNSGALYIDNQLKLMFPTIGLGALSGTSVWLADGLKGNIDDVCLFEQALPAELIAEFGKQTPNGDEMGLINLLTFSCVKRNASGVMEQVFSPDNQRVFRDANGNVVSKVQPLLVDDLASQADKSNYAPVRDRGILTSLPFNWTYQESELLINIKAQPREINKRTMYLTVRDVEDLNGNRLPSPVMWTVYANLNSIVWSAPAVRIMTAYESLASFEFQCFIINQTGMTRQYTIDNLPTWLSASTTQGTLEAEGNKMVTFTASLDLKPGLHNHVVYLTDDQGLSAPLLIEVEVFADCPYEDPETGKYPYNMSLCGQVMIGDAFDTDPEDKVIAIYNNECVGMANVDFDRVTNKSRVYLTVFGDDKMNRKPIQFRLWQASTGKVYDLSPNCDIVFAHGAVYGCGDSELVILTTNGNERQTIKLNAGWNWTSFNLDLRQYVAKIDKIMTADQPWMEGDLIKNPATRHFTVYSDSLGRFVGDFDYLRYIYTYMIYSRDGNTMHISGNNLPADSMYVTVAGNGQWSALPCLLREATPLQKALGDYYDYASPGDIIKAHNRFAYFSEDKKWVGDLTSLRPGEGYFLRRLAPGNVKIHFFNSPGNTPKREALNAEGSTREAINAFTNPHAATNMTMIARLENSSLGAPDVRPEIRVFINDELAAVAQPIDSLYFLTIQSDKSGTLRFETLDGIVLTPLSTEGASPLINSPLMYSPNAHAGSLKAPVVLRPAENTGVYKVIENNHVVIIRNNEKYDVTGKKME